MPLYQSYIVSAVEKVIAEAAESETPLTEVGSPLVANPDGLPFPDNVIRQLEFYKDRALEVEDFESFTELIDEVVKELELIPATDNEKVASVLNLYRKMEDLEPL